MYTKIRGEWYDFATFQHPGGPIALNLTKDRDATALFESHHLLSSQSKMDTILKKYKVKIQNPNKNNTNSNHPDHPKKSIHSLQLLDETNDDGAHYQWKDFHNDPFVKDLKLLLVDYFTPIAKARNCTLYQAAKATPERWALVISLFITFVATIPFYISGQYWALFVTPQLAWVVIANYWHDCLHFSFSSDWRINAWLPYLVPLLSSPWLWYHQHVLGHHAYTNIGYKDPDLAHAPQLLREHSSIKWKKLHGSQGFQRMVLVWSIAVSLGLNFLNDFKTNLKSSYNNVVPYAKLKKARLIAHILGRGIYFFLMFVWPYLTFSIGKATMWVIISNTSFSLSFMVNSQINHLTEDCTDGHDPNFLKHQVLTAQDFGRDSWFCGLFSGHLNLQIEHHLFPFVNHCHLVHLAPKVEEICKKHGVKYHKADGYVDAFYKHFNHTKEMARL